MQSPRDHTICIRRRGDGWHASGDLSCRMGDPRSLYAEWDWDGERLAVRNDRYGMVPIFYLSEPTRVILSTSIEGALRAGAPADLDHRAIAVMLRLDHPLGDDTPFKFIRTVPPGVRAHWERSGLRLVGGPVINTPNGLNREQAVSAYVEGFRRAIQRLPPEGPCSVPLSGGRDSRHILFALLEAGHHPDRVVTVRDFARHSGTDLSIASTIAESLGIHHEILTQPRARLAAEVDKNRLTSYSTPMSHAWFLPVAEFLASQPGCSYDGVAGDMLSRPNLRQVPADLVAYRAGRLAEIAASMFDQQDVLIRNMLTDDAHQTFAREPALDRLVEELAKHTAAPNPLLSFWFWNRTRRYLGPVIFGIFRRTRVWTPYLDEDLFDLLTGLAPEVIMQPGEDLHTATIKRGYPQYAHFPFETHSSLPGGGSSYHRAYARQALVYLSARRPTYIRASYLLPRLVRCVLDPNYAPSVDWLAPRAIYVAELRGMIERAGLT